MLYPTVPKLTPETPESFEERVRDLVSRTTVILAAEALGISLRRFRPYMKSHNIKPSYNRLVLTREQAEAAVATMEQGVSQGRVAEGLGMSPKTLRDLLRQYGLQTRWQGPAIPPGDAEKIRRLVRDEGLLEREIADLYGVHQVTVSHFLIRHGIAASHGRACEI